MQSAVDFPGVPPAHAVLSKELFDLRRELAKVHFKRFVIWVPSPLMGVPVPVTFNLDLTPFIFDKGIFTVKNSVTLVKLDATVKLQGGVRVNAQEEVTPILSAELPIPTLTGLLPEVALLNWREPTDW